MMRFSAPETSLLLSTMPRLFISLRKGITPKIAVPRRKVNPSLTDHGGAKDLSRSYFSQNAEVPIHDYHGSNVTRYDRGYIEKSLMQKWDRPLAIARIIIQGEFAHYDTIFFCDCKKVAIASV